MVNRPLFLRGLRRFAVRFDVDVVEVIGTVVLLALMLAIGITMALAAPRQAVDCPPPSEHQVLVWAWTTDGAASCQYIDRSLGSITDKR